MAFHSLLWGCHGLAGHTDREAQGAFSLWRFHITLVIPFLPDNLKEKVQAYLRIERVLSDFQIGVYYDVYDGIYKKKKTGSSLEPILFD